MKSRLEAKSLTCSKIARRRAVHKWPRLDFLDGGRMRGRELLSNVGEMSVRSVLIAYLHRSCRHSSA